MKHSAPPEARTKREEAGAMGALSELDVSKLIDEPAADSRIDVMRKIARHHRHSAFTQKERSLAEHVFRLMLKDTEIRVREALAEQLKDHPGVPRDIIVSLAHDAESVALPVIEISEVLNDGDLMEFIGESSGTAGKRKAVARRKRVSSPVASALIEKGEVEVVHSLVANPGADIPLEGYDTIVHKHGMEHSLLEEMAHRPGLPLTIAEKLISRVSDELAEMLEHKYRLAATVIDFSSEQAREQATLRLIEQETSEETLDVLAQQLLVYRRLTPSLVLSALCRGHLTFFELCMARLARIPRGNAAWLLHDSGPLGFEALYRKAEMPEGLFDAMRLVFLANRAVFAESGAVPGSSRLANRLIEWLMNKNADREIENLSYVIALIRQQSAAEAA